MKTVKRLVVLVVGISFLFSLFGCRSHLVDKTGMVNNLYWESFELSRCDSYSQYNFGFILESSNNCYLLKGECRDEEGNIYESYDGIKIPDSKVEKLRSRFELDNLPDIIPDENEKAGSTGDEEPFLLDATKVDLILKYPDGSTKEKAITAELSIEIYEQLLPYFINDYKNS